MTELLEYYGRLEMTGPGEYDRVETAYEAGNGEKIIKPAKAKINSDLRQRLGERHAAPYLIATLEKIPGTRRRRFGLRLSPRAIRIRCATSRDSNTTDMYAAILDVTACIRK